jgi:DNA-binding NarL/FixJ family response regulator
MTSAPLKRRLAATAEPARHTESSRVRCIVVDDHPAIRAGLRELLAIEPGLSVLEAFADAKSALAFAQASRVDVAVVDYQLGGRSGLWLCRRLREMGQSPTVVIYSAFSEWLLSAACVVAGASALVDKSALGSELARVIRELAGGGRELPPISPVLADAVGRQLDTSEQAIFGMMVSGVPEAEIARTLRMRDADLDATLWTMLRKLERVPEEK